MGTQLSIFKYQENSNRQIIGRPFEKGFTPWNKGKKNPYSKDVLEKIRKASTGRKCTEEQKAKTRAKILGRRHSEESRDRMSIARGGKGKARKRKSPIIEITRICANDECNNEFTTLSCRTRIYCSKKCSFTATFKRNYIHKGKDRLGSKTKNLWENPEYRQHMRDVHKGQSAGEKNKNWKGGITPELKKIRNSCEFVAWRKAVYQRDNHTCQKYKIRGCKLHAHHILNFSNYTELRFDVNNGITLSEKAHNEFHVIYGRSNNTREQLEEFLKPV